MKNLLDEMRGGFAIVCCLGLFTLLGTCAADNSREVRELIKSIERLERSVNDLTVQSPMETVE